MADGEIRINTKLDNKNFIQGSRQLADAIKSFQSSAAKMGKDLASSANGYGTAMLKSIKATQSANEAMRDLRNQADLLYSKMNKFSQQKFATKEFKNAENEIQRAEKSLERMREKQKRMQAEGKDQSPAWKSINEQIEKATEEADKYDRELQRLKEHMRQITSPEARAEAAKSDKAFEAHSKEVEETSKAYAAAKQKEIEIEKRLDSLYTKQEKLESKGEDRGSQPYVALLDNIKEAEAELDSLKAKRDSIAGVEGKGFVFGKDTDEYGKMQEAYNTFQQKLADIKSDTEEAFKPPYMQAWESMTTLTGMISEGFGRIQNAASGALHAIQNPSEAIDRALGTIVSRTGQAIASFARMAGSAAVSFLKRLASEAKNAAIQLAKLAANAVSSGLKKIGSAAGNAVKGLLGMNRAQKSANGGMKTGLKNVLKYAFGIRSMFFLFRRLRAAISEGFGELKKQNPEVKAALDSLSKSFNGLKGSLAAAFAPIVTAVAPMLTTLINMLTRAINTIGAFFAALTGKSTVAQSIGAIGSSAGKSSGKVKELKRELAGFDELNILKGKDNGGGGGGGGSGSGFSYRQVPIEGGIKDFTDRLREAWENGEYEEVGHILANGINNAFAKAKELISWDNVSETVQGAVEAIAGVFNGLIDPEKGIDFAQIGSTFAEGIRTIINSANLLLVWIRWGDVGGAIARFFNGLVDTINPDEIANLFVNAFAALAEAIRGFATDFKWGDAGLKFGMTVYNLLMNVPWKSMAYSIGELINGVIESLWSAAEGFEWGDAGERFGTAVNTLVGKVNWFKMGQSLAALVHIPIAYLKGAVSTIDWGDAGQKFSDAVNGFFSDESKWEDAGDTINEMVHGMLEFGQAFLDGFSSGQAAENIKAAIKEIDWTGIAKQAWTLFKTALAKLGNFITVLFGGEDVEVPVMPVIKPGKKGENYKIEQYTDSGSEQRDRNDYALDTSASGMGQLLSNLVKTILQAASQALQDIPWADWGDKVHDFFINIDWLDIAKKLWNAIIETAKGLGELLYTSLFGKEALEEKREEYAKENARIEQRKAEAQMSPEERAEVQAQRIQQATAQGLSDGLNEMMDEIVRHGGFSESFGLDVEDLMEYDPATVQAAVNSFVEEWNKAYENNPITLDGDDTSGLLGIIDAWNALNPNAQFKTIGNDAVEGFELAFTEDTTVKAASSDLAQSAIDGSKDTLDENSPSKVFEEIGEYAVAGLINGLQTLPTALQTVWKNLPAWAQKLLNSGNLGLALNLKGGSGSGVGEKEGKKQTKETRKLTKEIKKNTNKRRAVDIDFEGTKLDALMDGESTAVVTVGFVPKGETETDDDSGSGLLGWLTALFEPGVPIYAILQGIANGSLSLSDIFDTILDVVAFLTGKDRDSLTLGSIFDTILNVVALLTGKDRSSLKLGDIFGTIFGVLALLMGKDPDSPKLGGVFGTVFGVLALLMGKDPDSPKLGGVFGTVFGVLALLMGKDPGSLTLKGIFGSVFGVLSKLTGAEQGSKMLEDVYTSAKSKVFEFASQLTGRLKNSNELKDAYLDGKGSFRFVSNLQGLLANSKELKDYYLNKNGNFGFRSNLKGRVDGSDTISSLYGTQLGVKSTLSKNNGSVADLYGADADGKVPIEAKVHLKADNSQIRVRVQGGSTLATIMTEQVAALGGFIRAGGKLFRFAKGGALRGSIASMFGGINRYAGGTSRAHGTMFLAGEAGPEVVGHVGGRTEVLNKSQMAQAIYSAVVAGMTGAVNALGKYIANHMTTCTNAIVTTISANSIASGVNYYTPAMANGSIMPYEVSAQIARSTQALQNTLDANNDQLIQAIASAVSNATLTLVNAIQRANRGTPNQITTQRIIDEINRQSQMYNRSPLKGV